MQETSIRESRQVIAAGLAVAILLGGAGFLIGRLTVPSRNIAAAPPVENPLPSPEPVATPALTRTLGRVELIDLARQAADAQVSGMPPPQRVADAAGQRFELTLPFGCLGPSAKASDAAMGWQIDEEAGVMRIRAKPQSWPAKEWGLPEQDAVLAGFWIERPWASRSQCPMREPGSRAEEPASPAPAPEQTLAIARLGTADGRAEKRGFEKVERVVTNDMDTSAGLTLRLTGKLDRSAGGAPVRCIQHMGPAYRPKCVVVASFDEVRVENAATGDVLGVWDERSTQR